MAYRIEEAVFAHLDHREKNGYVRHEVRLQLDDDESVDATMYLAAADNPAFLGAASEAEIARHVAFAAGPSGPNRDYVLHLADALVALGIEDAHVAEVARLLRDA
jgi:cation transport regulator ChaC